jgi:MAE_28990/MAE_18760-like HEPN
MQTVILEFDTRVIEINEYFSFLEALINETTKLATLGNDSKYEIKNIDRDLAKTLKANGFLLLYNLIESSMRNAVKAIFDELEEKRVSYDSVTVEIKKIVLQNLKNRSLDSIHTTITNISIDIISAGFSSKDLFSGNIDRAEITNTARKYGFSYDTDYSKTKHGESLYGIMKNRNDLAHGNKSFSEVGRETSVEDLLKIKEEVIEYIRQILININKYLVNQEYLET